MAVSVAVWAVVTAETVAVKLALVAPEDTVTEAGTVTALLLLDRLTARPPVPAAAERVTVQASVPAPVMEARLQARELTAALPDPELVWPLPCNLIFRLAPFEELVEAAGRKLLLAGVMEAAETAPLLGEVVVTVS